MRINHECWFCCKIQMSIAIENSHYCIIAHLLTISCAMFLLRCRNRIIEHQNPTWLANIRQRPTNPSSFALSHEQREHKGLQPYRMPQTMASLTFASSTESLTSLKESFLQLEIAKAIQSLSHWDSYWSMNRVYCDVNEQRCKKNRVHQMSQHSVPTFRCTSASTNTTLSRVVYKCFASDDVKQFLRICISDEMLLLIQCIEIFD